MRSKKSNSSSQSTVNTNANTKSHSSSSSSSSFVVDGITVRSEVDNMIVQRFGRHYRRRPDRHPFILDVPSSIFFASRSMPAINSRYPVVVGESFWRLAAYIDSVPSRVEERIANKSPHLLLRGYPGSGKSFLLAAATALLGFGPQSVRPKQLNYLASDYRTILLGDCRRWLESDDPLTYFRMELLACFRDNCKDHRAEDHLGCLVCVEPFTRVEQVRHFMERCCRWCAEHQPDTLFVFFIDQAEELNGKTDSLPYQIIHQLLQIPQLLLIFSVSTPYEGDFPLKGNCGSTLDIPYRLTSGEFAKHIEVHSNSVNDKMFAKDMAGWKDIRLWTGSVPSELSDLMTRTPGATVMERLYHYRKHVAAKTSNLTLHISKLNVKQRNILLIILFATILRIPIDMSGDFNLRNIHSLGPNITSHLLLHCLQSFYHSSDGIITVKGVPCASGMASHLALSSHNILTSIFRGWTTLFDNVVHAILQSKLLCSEVKRRMSRFYAHARLLWGHPDWTIKGESEMGESIKFTFKQARVMIFAGQVPTSSLLTSIINRDLDHHGVPGNGDYDVIAYIPGRSSYWFFDFFIFHPRDRRLYAVTTSAVVGTWLKELSSNRNTHRTLHSTGNATNSEEGLLTPAMLLDQWRDLLKKNSSAGLKIPIKCVVVKTMDLMTFAGYTGTSSNSAGGSLDENADAVAQLAKHLGSSVINGTGSLDDQ